MDGKNSIRNKVIAALIMITVCFVAQFFIQGDELIVLMIILATVILKE